MPTTPIDPMTNYNQGWTNYYGLSGKEQYDPNSMSARQWTGLAGLGPGASMQAYANLLSLLGAQGRTDPAMMNQIVSGIQRGTQGQQQAVQGTLAQRGLGGSGVGQALNAAVGQAGMNQISDVRAREAQLAEERRRQDLGLFMQMVLDPALAMRGIGASYDQSKRQNSAAKWGALLGGAGSILGGLGSMPWGSDGGGN